MSTKKPGKPWRVIITGPDVRAESAHTSEDAAYSLIRAALGGDSPAEEARVEQWSEGRWWHFETVNAEDVP
ncbi:hypothetical protein OG285_32490 [Streptomyces sp. NBC_01471]|uniref:hypothetical protein n=1 Tax=Streptomyces sp. NBC_01471 TaxID=2903879 RepID=UPI0032451DD0